MKKYLNSVEEVVKALKEGAIIFYGENDSPFEYKLIDGFLCSNDGYISPTLHFYPNRFYTEEPEPLKFEVNRAYKTKGGYMAFLYIISNNNMAFLSPDYPNYQFFTNGLGLRTEESPFDIVGYWEEEK